jgi:hypothetical protein
MVLNLGSEGGFGPVLHCTSGARFRYTSRSFGDKESESVTDHHHHDTNRNMQGNLILESHPNQLNSGISKARSLGGILSFKITSQILPVYINSKVEKKRQHFNLKKLLLSRKSK